MKPLTAKALSPFAVVVLVLLQAGCCRSQNQKTVLDSKDRVVTISASSPPTSNNPHPCEVDFPVTLLRTSKKHTITWNSADTEYWILFDKTSSGFTTPVGSSSIYIRTGGTTGSLHINLVPPPATPPTSSIYFTYAIYNSNPNNVPKPEPCKSSTDERDTGLNVKP